jgi:hypothetical protein
MRLRMKQRRDTRLENAGAPAELAGPVAGLPAAVFTNDDRSLAEPVDRSPVVTIVTGLPRSGASMMMQMLAAYFFSAVTR